MEPQRKGSSPWGRIDHLKRFERDGRLLAISVSTPSHGGFWVPPELMEHIPAELRSTSYSNGGWFEEDCDWAIPYVFLGLGPLDQFADQTVSARFTLKHNHKTEVPPCFTPNV